MKSKTNFLIVFLTIVLMSCHSDPTIDDALKNMTIDHLKENISMLASDEFLGRAPCSLGEEKTIHYLIDQFKKLGLKPADGNSFLQEVPLFKNCLTSEISLRFSGSKGAIELAYRNDFVGVTPQPVEQVDIKNAEVVFAGYGIVAPEYQWNDYKGIDVKGKTVLILVNDPGFATGDTALFSSKALTWYGRWTYKYEEAVKQGAKTVIIIYETNAAAYPWSRLINSFSGNRFYLEKNVFTGSNLQFTGWMTTDAAKKVFRSAGLAYEELFAGASKRGFKAVSLNLKSFIHFTNKTEHCISNNVAALLPGSLKKDECVIYSAHWDHLGVKPSGESDSIFNGALDNAIGVAAMLEVAKGFTSLSKRPKRSVLFLSVTCEEPGLLGSEYYASNPIFPLAKTIGAINIDGLGIFGRTKDMTIIGMGYSQLDEFATTVLKRQGKVVSPDPTPEKGGFFRSDHFSFIKKGVPALYLVSGTDNLVHGKAWGIEMDNKWTREHYHMPSDNYQPTKWDFNGMIEDVKTYFEIGYELSRSEKFPQWKKKSPLKLPRENGYQK